jgi:transposase-like protein
MNRCPRCNSMAVFRSRSTDKQVFRLFLCQKVRCHHCGHGFLLPLWKSAGKDLSPPTSDPDRQAA